LLQYLCEWCKQAKRAGDTWILGFAAERVGAASAQREITIVAEWPEAWAGHPLAVHFCCEEHKENYVCALLGTGSSRRQPGSGRRKAGNGRSARAATMVIAEKDAPQKTRATSRRKQQGRKRKASFSAPDEVRAHGLGVLLNDSLLS